MQKKIFCYYASWASDRPGNSKCEIQDLDPTLCTHAIYAHARITKDNDIQLLDYREKTRESNDEEYKEFNDLHLKNPALKTLIALGNYDEPEEPYYIMAWKYFSQENLIENLVKFLQKHGFDGPLFDFEYPESQGDFENAVKLFTALRQRFEGTNYIMGYCVASKELIDRPSEYLITFAKIFDFVIIQTSDIHWNYHVKTALFEPLHPGPDDSEEEKLLNIEGLIDWALKQGVCKDRLVIGLRTSGNCYQLTNPLENGIGAPTSIGSRKDFMGYNEICEKFEEGGWTVEYDDVKKVSYATKGDWWISYNDVRSISEKARFIKKLDLAGILVTPIDEDDFNGISGEKFPLLKAVNKVLNTKGNEDSGEDVVTGTGNLEKPRYNVDEDTGNLGKIEDTKETEKSVENATIQPVQQV